MKHTTIAIILSMMIVNGFSFPIHHYPVDSSDWEDTSSSSSDEDTQVSSSSSPDIPDHPHRREQIADVIHRLLTRGSTYNSSMKRLFHLFQKHQSNGPLKSRFAKFRAALDAFRDHQRVNDLSDSSDSDDEIMDYNRSWFGNAIRSVGRFVDRTATSAWRWTRKAVGDAGKWLWKQAKAVGSVLMDYAPFILPLLTGPLGPIIGPIATTIAGYISKGVKIWEYVTQGIDIVQTVKYLLHPPEEEKLTLEQAYNYIVKRLGELDVLFTKYPNKTVPKQYLYASDGKTTVYDEQAMLAGYLAQIKHEIESQMLIKAHMSGQLPMVPTWDVSKGNPFKNVLGGGPAHYDYNSQDWKDKMAALKKKYTP